MQPGVVSRRPNDVVVAIGIDIENQHRNRTIAMQLKIGMPTPTLTTTINRRFQPTVDRNDITPAVAVDIAEPDSMPGDFRGQFVSSPLSVFLTNLPPGGKLYAVGQHVEPSVTIDVDQPRGLHWSWLRDFVRGPTAQFLAGMFDPIEFAAAIVCADQIEPAVAIHIDGQIGIVVKPAANLFHVPQEMAFPFRCFVPPAAGDNIQFAIAVHIERRRSGVGGVGVDGMHTELKIAIFRMGCSCNRKRQTDTSK